MVFPESEVNLKLSQRCRVHFLEASVQSTIGGKSWARYGGSEAIRREEQHTPDNQQTVMGQGVPSQSSIDVGLRFPPRTPSRKNKQGNEQQCKEVGGGDHIVTPREP